MRLSQRHLQNRCNGGRVVRGELRVDGIRRVEQRAGAGQVGYVGVVLVREHRVVRQAHLLGALDFRVPVRPLDQPAHQAQLVFAGDRGDVPDQLQRAGLIGLQGQAKALPLRLMLRHQRRQCLEHLQREFQPIHFLGVDGQAEVGAGSQLAQAPDARHQFSEHARVLRILVARVQRAELDGNTVILLYRPRPVRSSRQGLNGMGVALQVAQGVGAGAGALAQHVVGIPQSSGGLCTG